MGTDSYSTWSAKMGDPLVGSLGQLTPSDTQDLAQVTRQIRVTATGVLAIVWASGVETIEPVMEGDVFDWRIRRLKATGTSASARGYW